MGNEVEKRTDANLEDIKIENNPYLGQDEGDFEEAFKETFKKKALNKEDHEEHEDCQEINHKAYYLQSDNFIQKEEPAHICQPNYFLKSLNKINLNGDIIDENNEKENFKLNEDHNYLICEDNLVNHQDSECIINGNSAEKKERLIL